MRITEAQLRDLIREALAISGVGIVGNKAYRVDIGTAAGPRRFVVVETETEGRVPFYESSGRSTADKASGEWHVFLGFKPYKGRSIKGVTLFKTQREIDMVRRGGELAEISRALPAAVRDLPVLDAKSWEGRFLAQINEKISESHPNFSQFSPGLFQAAVGNKWLYDLGALAPGSLAQRVDPGGSFIGLREIPMSELGLPENKILPAIYSVNV